ncbi:hypothetical protein BCR34DRAFT_189402 [Clohesyomyces aquaticus]|uniref:RING-type domain-containing protein n=1 Tax=Clohesyomyces aquaticus TaxID=1231657 RepID=A0A1Y1ZZC6_9PLEO|nr:hypothetical protein BCR34DRAFT_189402 [Clohesyomyces aquaticus]
MDTIPVENTRCPHCWTDLGTEEAEYDQPNPEEPENLTLLRELPFQIWRNCNDPVRTICGHIFGKSCLAQSLLESQNCPICRRSFNADAQIKEKRRLDASTRPRDLHMVA